MLTSFGEWATHHELLLEEKAFSARCHTAIKRPAKGPYFTDASLEVVGGLWVERKVFWRYDSPK